jgi:hypothetical protein
MVKQRSETHHKNDEMFVEIISTLIDKYPRIIIVAMAICQCIAILCLNGVFLATAIMILQSFVVAAVFSLAEAEAEQEKEQETQVLTKKDIAEIIVRLQDIYSKMEEK